MELRVETKGVDNSHKFVKKTGMIKLHVVCKDDKEQPLKQKPYKLTIDGKKYDGTTDGDGAVIKDIPVSSREGSLEVEGYIYPIRIAHLDPITEVSGVKARLNNLGYDCGGTSQDMDDATADSIRMFQKDNKLEETGALDDALRGKLKEKHGC